jgi:phage-related protein
MAIPKKYRYIETYQDHFEKFFVKQTQKVKDKIIWTLELIEDIEHVPKTYLDIIEDKLYEVRVKQGSNIFRIFCFFDKNKLVILMNGFQKKTQETPKKEIEKARRIMKEYFKSKPK